MALTSIKRRATAVSVAGAAALALGAGVAPAEASAPARASAPADVSVQKTCDHGALCVKLRHVDTGKTKWKDLYYCKNWYISKKWVPTRYINNQTPGTKGKFKNHDRKTIMTTKAPYADKKVKKSIGVYTWYIKPC
ncbi:hypothetical protein AB0Q95_06925 [Streptomyces sp. NPDC059900]|uniref:hypothetical protein n=1 Tax=Streptomyces sp. NPDC059900 TaxID=3155816 RepID=UPI00343D7B4D